MKKLFLRNRHGFIYWAIVSLVQLVGFGQGPDFEVSDYSKDILRSLRDETERTYVAEINVTAHGAIGDGSTNNWDAFKKVLAAAEKVRGRKKNKLVKVYFPSGIYRAWNPHATGEDGELRSPDWASVPDIEKSAKAERMWGQLQTTLFEINESFIRFEGSVDELGVPNSIIQHLGPGGQRFEDKFFQRFENWTPGRPVWLGKIVVATNNKVYEVVNIGTSSTGQTEPSQTKGETWIDENNVHWRHVGVPLPGWISGIVVYEGQSRLGTNGIEYECTRGGTIGSLEPTHTQGVWKDDNGVRWLAIKPFKKKWFGNLIVRRGFTFYCSKKRDHMEYIELKNLEIDGTARPTGAKSPYTYSDFVNQWDTSHKGFVMGFGNGSRDLILIDNCDLHDYRGEVVYAGGQSNGRISLIDSKVHGANSSAMSCSADVFCFNTEFFDSTNACIESVHYSRRDGKTVQNGYYERCVFRGNGEDMLAENNPHILNDRGTYNIIVTGTDVGSSVVFDNCTVIGQPRSNSVAGKNQRVFLLVGAVNDFTFRNGLLEVNGPQGFYVYTDSTYGLKSAFAGFTFQNNKVVLHNGQFFGTPRSQSTNFDVSDNVFELHESGHILFSFGNKDTSFDGVHRITGNKFMDGSGTGGISRILSMGLGGDRPVWNNNDFSDFEPLESKNLTAHSVSFPEAIGSVAIQPNVEIQRLVNLGNDHGDNHIVDLDMKDFSSRCPDGFETTLANYKSSKASARLPDQPHIADKDRLTTFAPGESIRIRKTRGNFEIIPLPDR